MSTPSDHHTPDSAGEEPVQPTLSFEKQTSEAPAPTAPEQQPASHPGLPRRSIRMRTVVLGLVLLVIAGSVLVHQLTDVRVDAGVVILTLMIGVGALLIVGARRPSTPE